MLIIEKRILDELIAHGRQEFPNEACGILAGAGSQASRIYRMRNVDKSPDSYFMDAKEQLAVIKQLRTLGIEMTAIYHSHVASRAYPSAKDVELAFYPDVSYVIASLLDKGAPGVRSFKIKEGNITEEELKIIDS